MSSLKIQEAVNENLLAHYGHFSLGFDKKKMENKTEEIAALNLQIHTQPTVSLKNKQKQKNPEPDETKNAGDGQTEGRQDKARAQKRWQ